MNGRWRSAPFFICTNSPSVTIFSGCITIISRHLAQLSQEFNAFINAWLSALSLEQFKSSMRSMIARWDRCGRAILRLWQNERDFVVGAGLLPLGLVVGLTAYAMTTYSVGGWIERSAVLVFVSVLAIPRFRKLREFARRIELPIDYVNCIQ